MHIQLQKYYMHTKTSIYTETDMIINTWFISDNVHFSMPVPLNQSRHYHYNDKYHIYTYTRLQLTTN